MSVHQRLVQGSTHFIQNVPVDKLIDSKESLRPVFVGISRPHLDRNGPETGHRPQVLYAFRRERVSQNDYI